MNRLQRALGSGLLLLVMGLSACGQSPPRALGTLEYDRINLPAPAAERIIAVNVEAGERVRAGQLLLRLDPAQVQAELGADLVSTHLMDEAERCHRLAILDRGRLVADGTPLELAGRLRERTLVVDAPEPRRAQRALLDVGGVLSGAQVGNSLRLLIEHGNGGMRDKIESALAQAGLQAKVTTVAPNLEDVFVAVTRAEERQQRAPAP